MNSFSIKQTAIRQVEQHTGHSIDITNAQQTTMLQWFVKGAAWADEQHKPAPLVRLNSSGGATPRQAHQVIRAVCNHLGIPEELLYKPCRLKHIVKARHMIYYLLRRQHYTLSQIAALFNQDHSTVVHGLRRASVWEEECRGLVVE